MLRSLKGSSWLLCTVSASVFLFFAMMLSVPRGYNLGVVGLLLSSLYFFAKRPSLDLNGEDKILAWLLVTVFLAGLLSFVYHGNPPNSLDLFSRYLLCVPILLLVVHVSPRSSYLWAGIVLGCVSGAVVGAWQVYLLGKPRAIGFTGVIQYGDIALMLGIFCLAGLLWAKVVVPNKNRWQLLLCIGALAGGYASIESASRGGWVALPAIVLLFCIACLSKRNIKKAGVVGAVLCIGLIVVATTVPRVHDRLNEAVSDVQKYRQGDADTSIGARFALWEAVFIMIPQKPLLGWSEEDYEVELQRLVERGDVPEPAVRLGLNTHNNYLELWALHGLVGLLSVLAVFLAFFYFFAKRLRNKNLKIRAFALCGTTLIAGYSVFCMSQNMLGRNNTLLFFVISLVVLWGCLRYEERISVSHG